MTVVIAKKILVVDDNVDLAQSLREVLESAGHEAAIATDGAKALELAGALTPDVAIVDIELPVMDGYELARHLRELPHMNNCLFIAVTGYGQEHDERQSRDSGFRYHLVKPVDVDRLLHVLG
jgi:CheY-like chemotaxis protein